MILQSEIYWSCATLAHILPESLDLDKLYRLGLVQFDLAKKLAPIAEQLYNYSATAYSAGLVRIADTLKHLASRTQLLALAHEDPGLSSKQKYLAEEYRILTNVLWDCGWASPVNCCLAVDQRGHIVDSENEHTWSLHPKCAYGCFNGEDQALLVRFGAYRFLHPAFFAQYLNTPNWFWWASILAYEESEEAYRESVTSYLACSTETDTGSIEANSVPPTVEHLQRVQEHLPAGLRVKPLQSKVRETSSDVLASKEAISGVQMALLRLLY